MRGIIGRKRGEEDFEEKNEDLDEGASNSDNLDSASAGHEMSTTENEFSFSSSSFERLSNPAKVYPFQLDTFQQALLD